jgi:hypothetical protein
MDFGQWGIFLTETAGWHTSALFPELTIGTTPFFLW